MTEETDEEIQARLAGNVVAGLRTFRGRPLAPLSRGLRDLHRKVLRQDDSDTFHDTALLFLLSEAHAPDEAARLEARTRLVSETDNVPRFRGRISTLLDDLSDADVAEAKRATDDLLGLVELAQTSILPDPQKNGAGVADGEPSPTTTPSTLSTLPESSPAITPTGTAGN